MQKIDKLKKMRNMRLKIRNKTKATVLRKRHNHKFKPKMGRMLTRLMVRTQMTLMMSRELLIKIRTLVNNLSIKGCCQRIVQTILTSFASKSTLRSSWRSIKSSRTPKMPTRPVANQLRTLSAKELAKEAGIIPMTMLSLF